MEAWFRAILSLAPSTVQSLARGIGDRFATLLSWLAVIFANGRKYWLAISLAWNRLRTSLKDLATETVTTVRWLITVWVPGRITVAVNNLRTLLTTAINAARREATSLVTTLRNWATARVNELVNALSTFRTWITGRVNATIATLAQVRDIVVMLLTSPERLARWVVAAMVRELYSYADSNFDRIASWVRRKSVAYTVSAVKRIEDVIARLL